jgi:beta-glucosidase
VLELVVKGMPVLELDESFDADAHHALAREAAAQSVVLLENDGVLPLPADTSIAVVGEFARTPRYQGAGSSQVNPTRLDALLDELGSVFGEVPFAAGYGVGETANDAELLAEAERVAGSAGTVVMVIGLPAADESEGFDRTHLNLPANQLTAVQAVAAVNPNLVVVVVNGSTVVLGDVAQHARALVEAWLGGQAAGGAIVDVLTGKVNPSGRLAETIPHRLEDNSSYLNFPGDPGVVRYGEGLFIGYRGYDKARQDVAYPFGFGLSYTDFALSDLQVKVAGSVADGTLAATVTATVTNIGDRDGAEVVQVYVHDVDASVTRPVRELKGFAKVAVAAGASETVSVQLDQRAFSFWSVLHGRWVVEAGDFVVEVGTNSRDLPFRTTIAVDAPSLALPLTRDSTLQEWMADPVGRELVEREVAAGQPAAVLEPELISVIGTMPMSSLANFGGMSLDHDALDRVAQAWHDEIEPSHTRLEAARS